jgi:hypothetical protein
MLKRVCADDVSPAQREIGSPVLNIIDLGRGRPSRRSGSDTGAPRSMRAVLAAGELQHKDARLERDYGLRQRSAPASEAAAVSGRIPDADTREPQSEASDYVERITQPNRAEQGKPGLQCVFNITEHGTYIPA